MTCRSAAYTNLGNLLGEPGDPFAAAGFLWKGIAGDEAVYGLEDPEVAANLSNLAVLLRNTGESIASDSLLRRALAIYESRLGANSPQARGIRESPAKDHH